MRKDVKFRDHGTIHLKILNFITMVFFAGGYDGVKRNEKQLEGRTAVFVKKSLKMETFLPFLFLFHAL